MAHCSNLSTKGSLLLLQPSQKKDPTGKCTHSQYKRFFGNHTSRQHGVGITDAAVLPGSNSRRGDSAFTTKSPNAPSSSQDEPTSTKELTSHWNANFAILLSLALMLMHLMTFTEHRLPSVKTAPGFAAAPGSQEACLLQQLAQLDPQQLRPVLPTKKPDKERTNAQLHPLQQAAVQAGKARDAALAAVSSLEA